MRRCLFCSADSAGSRSVEHIVPESLGNTTAVLPRGVVCDKCNNYFAVKVERPFLESETVKALRYYEAIPSKKGRVPELSATLGRDEPVTLHRHLRGPFPITMGVSPGAWAALLSGVNIVNAPGPTDDWPEYPVSRFLAKAALESMAHRLVNYPDGLLYLAVERQLDPIRRYARFGEGRAWPYRSRRIYDRTRPWRLADGSIVQRVWESDILVTDYQERYFVLAIFGLELTINLGHRSTWGYDQWLASHDNRSPLYRETGQERPMDGIPLCPTAEHELVGGVQNCGCSGQR
jgi:HNH endonuclease